MQKILIEDFNNPLMDFLNKKIIIDNAVNYVFEIYDSEKFFDLAYGMYIRDTWEEVYKTKTINLKECRKVIEVGKEKHPELEALGGLFLGKSFIQEYYNHYKRHLTEDEKCLYEILKYFNVVKKDKQKYKFKRNINLIFLNPLSIEIRHWKVADILKHELAHSVYNTNKEYAKKINQSFKKIKGKYYKAIHDYLSGWGYAEWSYPDEWHSSVIAGDDGLLDMITSTNIVPKSIFKMIEKLKKDFDIIYKSREITKIQTYS